MSSGGDHGSTKHLHIEHLLHWLMARTEERRPPDFIIYRRGVPQLLRWYIIPRNRVCNLYLHHFVGSDEDAALHDHPWHNLSVLLSGRYVEHTIRAGGVHVKTERRAGDIVARTPWTAHRVELEPGEETWSLFITGPKLRSWGFHCAGGWKHWRSFVDARDGGVIGAGCLGEEEYSRLSSSHQGEG